MPMPARQVPGCETHGNAGLACSMVNSCDDCIKYHLGKCRGKATDEEIEVFAIYDCHRRQHRHSALPLSRGVLGDLKEKVHLLADHIRTRHVR